MTLNVIKKVSIVFPVYNSERYIEEAVLSVINQSFDDWELIIVDDCSADNSINLIKKFQKEDSRIQLIQLEENVGAAVARNMAIDVSQGRYIAFLDSDDLWLPHKLEKQLAFMRETGCVFSYAAYERIDETSVVIGTVGVPSKVGYTDLLKTCVIGCLTAMYDTEYFGRVNMPLIRKRQDFALWLRLLKKVDFAYGINETLGQYRVRKGSISSNKIDASLYTWKMYRNIEKLPLFTACYYFIQYSFRGLLRSKWPRVARRLGLLL